MADECTYCLTPVLLQSLEAANKELARLRRKVGELELAVKSESDERYELQAQLVELLDYRSQA